MVRPLTTPPVTPERVGTEKRGIYHSLSFLSQEDEGGYLLYHLPRVLALQEVAFAIDGWDKIFRLLLDWGWPG